MKSVRSIIAGLMLLAGCGGSGAVPDVQIDTSRPLPPDPNTVLSERLDAQAPVAAIAFIEELARVPEDRNPVPGSNYFEPVATSYTRVGGTFDFLNRTATLSNGDFSVSGGLVLREFQGRDLRNYRFSGMLVQALGPDLLDPDDANRRISARVIFGLPTPPADLPASGTLQLRGDAVLSYEDDAGFTSYRSDAVIDADFNRSRVRVTITPEAGIAVETPFDTLERRNMILRDGAFQGGYARYLLNNRVVTPLDSGAASFARGQFFGSATGSPAEAGGMIKIEAANATVTAEFLAR